MNAVNIFWYRRDLRLSDNAALYHALKSENPVLPIFIFDRNILDKLEDKADRRVEFIHAALEEIQNKLVVELKYLSVSSLRKIESLRHLVKMGQIAFNPTTTLLETI